MEYMYIFIWKRPYYSWHIHLDSICVWHSTELWPKSKPNRAYIYTHIFFFFSSLARDNRCHFSLPPHSIGEILQKEMSTSFRYIARSMGNRKQWLSLSFNATDVRTNQIVSDLPFSKTYASLELCRRVLLCTSKWLYTMWQMRMVSAQRAIKIINIKLLEWRAVRPGGSIVCLFVFGHRLCVRVCGRGCVFVCAEDVSTDLGYSAYFTIYASSILHVLSVSWSMDLCHVEERFPSHIHHSFCAILLILFMLVPPFLVHSSSCICLWYIIITPRSKCENVYRKWFNGTNCGENHSFVLIALRCVAFIVVYVYFVCIE